MQFIVCVAIAAHSKRAGPIYSPATVLKLSSAIDTAPASQVSAIHSFIRLSSAATAATATAATAAETTTPAGATATPPKCTFHSARMCHFTRSRDMWVDSINSLGPSSTTRAGRKTSAEEFGTSKRFRTVILKAQATIFKISRRQKRWYSLEWAWFVH